MIALDDYLVFLGASLLLNITPGPDMIYTATRSMMHGRQAGFVSALAIATGGMVHTLIAAFGVALLFQQSPTALRILRGCGAAYLLWLGGKGLIRPAPTETAKGQTSPPRIYLDGLVVSVLNPKVALFLLAFLPQFTRPEAGHLRLQLITLGLSFCVTTLLTLSIVVFVFSRATWRAERAVPRSALTRVSGAVLVVLGLWLALRQ